MILIIWNVNLYMFCPISWILRSLLMHFNRLNHTVKEHTLNACVHCLTPSSPCRLICVHYVGVSWVFAKYSILSNCTLLKQQLRYYRRRYISHTPTIQYKLRNWVGKCAQASNRDDRTPENTVKQSRFKHLGELHKEWTEAGVSASRVTTLRHLQEKGYQAPSETETMSEASYLG